MTWYISIYVYINEFRIIVEKRQIIYHNRKNSIQKNPSTTIESCHPSLYYITQSIIIYIYSTRAFHQNKPPVTRHFVFNSRILKLLEENSREYRQVMDDYFSPIAARFNSTFLTDDNNFDRDTVPGSLVHALPLWWSPESMPTKMTKTTLWGSVDLLRVIHTRTRLLEMCSRRPSDDYWSCLPTSSPRVPRDQPTGRPATVHHYYWSTSLISRYRVNREHARARGRGAGYGAHDVYVNREARVRVGE